MGVATAIATDNYKDIGFNKRYINRLEKDGYESIFLDSLYKIDDLNGFISKSCKTRMDEQFGKDKRTSRVDSRTD
jgi:hypothetical protein